MKGEYHDGDHWQIREIANEIENRGQYRCVEDGQNRTLYHYQDGVWKPKGETEVESQVLELTNELLRPNNINQVIRIIKNRNRMDQEDFQMQDYIVPFRNGVYDLKTDEFKQHDPNFFLKYKHPVDYLEEYPEEYKKEFKRDFDPETDSQKDTEQVELSEKSRANEFIDSLVDTKRKKSILKETVGLALMTNYPIQEAPLLYGKGKNGKNMYVKMLKEMSGNWHTIDLGEFTDDQFAKAEMQGSSFVFFDELGYIKDPNKLKSFIGDEDQRVREMRKLGDTGKQRAIPIMAGNDIPTPPEQNVAFFRRFCIIDFPYTFTSEDDENKDQVPKNEIQRKYFNDYTLSKLATEVVQDLTKVLKKEGFTESHTNEEKRQIWNLKSSLVYSFLNMFVEQGEKPDQSRTNQCDAVIKEDLLEMCNDFVDSVNGTKVRQHELTQAIENNPDLDTGTDARKEGEDGKEHRAYSGLKLQVPSFHHIQGLDDLRDSRNSVLLQHSSKFEVLSAKQHIRTLDIVETELIGKVIKLIRHSDQSSLSLLRIARDLSLQDSDVKEIYESDYLNIDGKIAEGFSTPEISIASETLDQAIEESDQVIKETEGLKKPYDWLKDEISSWSKQTVKNKTELIEKGKDLGFSEDAVQETLDNLVNQGVLYEPQPNQVQKL